MDKETKQMFELILNKLDTMDNRQDTMDKNLDTMDKNLETMGKRQDEMYSLQKAFEENVKVTRAEQDKMMHMVADIQGKVTRLTSEVEDHESIIKQIRAIK
ncbi:hypothetical protein CLLI_25790 [Clostridium liquoris]|uniref:Uncharacterized protein n=1 Tax=Clostridium liquoris TaxID=1289519 RepID=A0A2T0B0S1_9CLOT|nr:hypothetical protein [Clostridium liquoris]PRR77167.1 hypothetical protein CLLI_25790 [Clostridium liquoris]